MTAQPWPLAAALALSLVLFNSAADAAPVTYATGVNNGQQEVSAANPLPVSGSVAGAAVSASNPMPVMGAETTLTATVTRPSDTNVYAANDAWADSTSAPTTGGFTLTSAGRVSGGSGIVTDLVVVSSVDPATLLQGEVWIFDSAVTAVNDNAAFALSDSDAVKLVGVVPFTLLTTTGGSGTNSYAQVSNLAMGFTASGTANLRFLVKVKNAYTPASAEVLTVRAKIVQTN